MVLLYMVTFTINIPQMLAYIPYMDPMGYVCLHITPRWKGNRIGLELGSLATLSTPVRPCQSQSLRAKRESQSKVWVHPIYQL